MAPRSVRAAHLPTRSGPRACSCLQPVPARTVCVENRVTFVRSMAQNFIIILLADSAHCRPALAPRRLARSQVSLQTGPSLAAHRPPSGSPSPDLGLSRARPPSSRAGSSSSPGSRAQSGSTSGWQDAARPRAAWRLQIGSDALALDQWLEEASRKLRFLARGLHLALARQQS